jgi:hypothetical protein
MHPHTHAHPPELEGPEHDLLEEDLDALLVLGHEARCNHTRIYTHTLYTYTRAHTGGGHVTVGSMHGAIQAA